MQLKANLLRPISLFNNAFQVHRFLPVLGMNAVVNGELRRIFKEAVVAFVKVDLIL
jgi:hypothetical protein